MLTIKVNSTNYKIHMRGHANYAKKGSDIVCAAASMLMYTLAETLLQFRQILEGDPEINIDEKDGDINSIIVCKPRPGFEANVQLVYQTLINGFQLLAGGYPDNVKIRFV